MAGKALLVCDDKAVADQLNEQFIAELGVAVSVVASAQAGIAALRDSAFDIVVAKLGMPGLPSAQLVNGLRAIDPDCVIVAYLEKISIEELKELYKLGIYDFISQPLNMERLFFLARKGMELHALMAANRKLTMGLKEQKVSLEKQNSLLAKRIEESTKNLTRLYEDLRATYMRTIKVLAQTIDARDHYTHSHSENVAKYAVAIASEMSLPAKEIEIIREACELHDLGKIAIRDSVLSKPAALNAEEWEIVKRHPVTGAKILEPLTFLSDVVELVRQHHEHYDGSGYPEGHRGDDIPLGARIIHIADAYESMVSARPYRKVPLTKADAIAEIKKNMGTQFDPKVVEAFLKVVDRL
jgi:putative nucleotidyltransferase with HDIG domain